MEKICITCSNLFHVTDGDKEFYAKIDVPEPTHCPDCRFQNRIAFRNEQRFYSRVCDMCKNPTISIYSKDKNCAVYCSKCWWSDAYDPLAYGRDFDFSRPFFEQYNELSLAVPKPAIMNMKSENCEYTNYSHENRNCYLLVGSAFSEDCYYSYRIFTCKNVVDCYDLQKSELCYECTQSRNLYNCTYCDSCENSSNMTFCKDCIGCSDCFGCLNLRNKKFHIYNRPYSEEEYHVHIENLKDNFEDEKGKAEAFWLTLPHRADHIINCENCTGDQLSKCKKCFDCFGLHNSEECSHIIQGDRNKFCSDVNFTDMSELTYNTTNCHQSYNVKFGNLVWFSSDVMYGTNCFSSNHLFGCVGMKRASYCILNKQYTKLEYEELVSRIIEHMKRPLQTQPRQGGVEFGEYYPMELSPFAYNETVANEYFPLTKEEAFAKGLKWKDDIYESVSTTSSDAIVCEATGRPFKLILKEVEFYGKMGLPTPKVHPFERHQRRMKSMLKFRLYNRNCAKCDAHIQTTYAPERPEIVYCEKCYLEAVG